MRSLSKRVDQVRVFSRSVLATPQYVLLSQILPRSRVVASTVKRSIVNNVASGYEILAQARTRTVNHTAVLVNAILASDISHSMEAWLKHLVETTPSVYDKAMDADYNATDIGGGHLHRLLDGNHTLWGAWKAVHGALPDDSILQETVGYFTALWRDLSTHVGLPLVTWDKTTYDQVANLLRDTFHIPKPWFRDMLHVNAVELFGTSIGAIAVALHWKRRDVRRFSKLCGSLGLATLFSANPALGVLTLVGLAKLSRMPGSKEATIARS